MQRVYFELVVLVSVPLLFLVFLVFLVFFVVLPLSLVVLWLEVLLDEELPWAEAKVATVIGTMNKPASNKVANFFIFLPPSWATLRPICSHYERRAEMSQ